MKEEPKDLEFIFRCTCEDLWHSTVFRMFYDSYTYGKNNENTGHDLYIHQHIEDVCFWRRLVNCIRYLFKQRKFWNYGETYLVLNKEEDLDMLNELIVFLQTVKAIATKPIKYARLSKKDDGGSSDVSLPGAVLGMKNYGKPED